MGFVQLETNLPVVLQAGQVLICTNAFAKTLIPDLDVIPARGQVLLTNSGGRIENKRHISLR